MEAVAVKPKRVFNAEELALIDVVHAEWIGYQTFQQPEETVISAVAGIFEYCEIGPCPMVIMCDSPLDCKKRAVADGYTIEKDRPNSLVEYWSIWYVGYCAMYDFGSRIGLDLDDRKLKLFSNWVKCCPFILYNKDVVYVSRVPHTLNFDKDSQKLHCETGKSCEFNDGWGIWTLEGVSVDEQIVMRPETQTLEQIEAEANEERKAIRLQRWHSKVGSI